MRRPRCTGTTADPLYVDDESRVSAWIDCVLDITEREERDGDSHLTSHYVFCRKVLGEPRMDALALAAGFRHVQLDRATCERVAAGWWDE